MSSSSSPPEPEWTVLYHHPGKFKGRGEFLRLVLEDAGVPYVNRADNLYGPTGCMDMFRGSAHAIQNDLERSDYEWPTLYPPAILHRPAGEPPVLVNQVGACLVYLADKLGYAPATDAEKARANSVMMNCVDYIADARASFHPVQNTMSYRDQKEEGDRASREFARDRMKKYLYHFDKVVHRATGGAGGGPRPVAGGPRVTFADFALFHVLDATVAQFNTEFYDMAWDNLRNDVPDLREYYAWMAARPNLVAYFASDRRMPWAGDSMM